MAAWANEFFKGAPASPPALPISPIAGASLPQNLSVPPAFQSPPHVPLEVELPSTRPFAQIPATVPLHQHTFSDHAPAPSSTGLYFLEHATAQRALSSGLTAASSSPTAPTTALPRTAAFGAHQSTGPTGTFPLRDSSVSPYSVYGSNVQPEGTPGVSRTSPYGSDGALDDARDASSVPTAGMATNQAPGSVYGLGAAPSSLSAVSRPERATPGLYEFEPMVTSQTLGRRQYDVLSIRKDFPILDEIVHGKRLVWLDNAATTQKPQSVIDRIAFFYEHENSNIHRAAHALAGRSTDAYEAARESSRRFLNAGTSQEIIFTRGTTEAINLVAQSWGRRHLRAGDEIVISWLEHHSNIVPWQLLCSETGAKLRVAPIDDDGQIILDEYERLFNSRTKLVSITQVSNALGTITPVKEMVQIAHRYGARVLVDGAQAVSHMRVDVQSLDCDFYVFSGHKVFGPTGIGVLYGKSEVLESMPPWQGGGNMIVDVKFDKTIYAPPPGRFEAGTGNIADAVGLGAAIEYVERIGIDNIARHEHELLEYGSARLLEVPRLRLIGTAAEKAGVMGFVIDGVPTEQVGSALSKEGIAVRAGHHCAQPALRRYGLETTVRPSLALYNTEDDIDRLVTTLLQLQSNFPR
jgi:cysteine desulfurase/selenocysteine lyase